jgi:transketolase
LSEALKAYDQLKNEGITIRVIDLYSVKPIDRETLFQAASDTDGNLILVEDHWVEGGLGEAVLEAFTDVDSSPNYVVPKLKVIHLAVRQMPSSGKPEELLHAARIDADAITQATKSLLKQALGTPV